MYSSTGMICAGEEKVAVVLKAQLVKKNSFLKIEEFANFYYLEIANTHYPII